MYASRIFDLFSSLQIWKDHVINWTKEEILRAHPAKGRAVIQEFNSRLARIGLEAGVSGQKAFSHGLFNVANK